MKTIQLLAASIVVWTTSAISESSYNPHTFVHLFEWQWDDIATECRDVLPALGYDAIQVSPANEHIDYPSWWARYQPVDFQTFESFSGTEAQLRSMIEVCHDAGIKVYADAVINHTADYGLEGVGTAGTPWKLMSHPGLDRSHYHQPICTIENYQIAAEVQNCNLGALPDLDTVSPYVREKLANYLRSLSDLGFDGMRIDAAKHMSAVDVAAIIELAGQPDVFLEVIGDPRAEQLLQPTTYTAIAPVTDFAARSAIYEAINGNPMALQRYWQGEGDLAPSHAITFVDNHDTERHTQQLSDIQKRLAEALLLTLNYGYPKVLSGYEFDNRDALPGQTQLDCQKGWTCWHRDPVVVEFVKLRRDAAGAPVSQVELLEPQVFALQFGPGRLLVNTSDRDVSVTWDPDLDQRSYCDLLTGHGSRIELDWWGETDIELSAYGMVLLREDAICKSP